jgi:glycosyltransferase involved in cell wall biosynthesis
MNRTKPINILTNFKKLPYLSATQFSKERFVLSVETFSPNNNVLDALKVFWRTAKAHILILNVAEPLLLRLCLFRYLFPWNRCLFISVDILLKRPVTLAERVKCRIQRILLRKVDAFILYFRDISRYSKYYGLRREKCIYVPFKVNQLENIQTFLAEKNQVGDVSDGDCVMAIGRTLRDLNTFISAMEQTGVPGVILRQSHSVMAEHGSLVPNRDLPKNVREEIHDGNQASFIRHIARAKVVVIPRYRWDLKSTGISNYLMAMAMGKCVIVSHGPGTTDLLEHDEAILVPPEDPEALAEAIKEVWRDTAFRKRIAKNGQEYAFSLKDEGRLLDDILNVSLDLLGNRVETG